MIDLGPLEECAEVEVEFGMVLISGKRGELGVAGQ